MSGLLAVASSLLWGSSDFLGGTLSRRLPPWLVVLWADTVVVAGLAVLGAALGDLRLDAGVLGWGGGAGLVGLVGIVVFYRALADGAMGVVAPLAGLGVVVPVAVGVAEGNRPSPAQLVGIVAAVLGIVLITSGRAPARGGPRVLLLAAASGASFGTVFVFLAEAEPHGTVTTLLVMRLVTVVVLGVAIGVRRLPVRVAAAELPAVTALGVLDVSANACFQLATDSGALAVVAVLSSLYPAVTTLLARAVHDERLTRRQLGGAIATVAAIALLAAGPGL